MNWICDGYTERSRIEAGGERLVVDYRPMLIGERRMLLSAMKAHKTTGDLSWDIADRSIAAHIVCGPAASALKMFRETNWDFWHKLFVSVTACERDDQQQDDLHNLLHGVAVSIRYPHLSHSICQHCRNWWYDPATGETEYNDSTGKPEPRIEGMVLACQTKEGCPNGTPDAPQSLSPKNRLALIHYFECDATHRFPDDAIVKRNARVIRHALANFRREDAAAYRRSVLVPHPIE